jgi:acetolactate synthase small subunit
MTIQDKDLIKKLEDLKNIKPNQDWANWLRSNILETKPQSGLYNKPKIRLAAFSFISKYQKVLVPSLLSFFLVSSFVFAQTTLPGNVLYPIKTLTQNAKIYLASDNTKPLVRLEIAKIRMEDLGKIENHQKEISIITQNVRKDLETVTQEIKKINKKQVALNVSKDIQERSKDLKAIVEKISLEDQEREELNKSVEDSQSQVLAYIMETTEEINQCPSYLQNKLVELEQYFSDTPNIFQNWKVDDVVKVRNWLGEASSVIRSGNCLEAMEKIESINNLMSIYSLDVQVETSTPESLN